MTLSHRNRPQDRRLAGNTFVARTKRSFGVASLCVVASLASVGALSINDVAAHHDESCFPVNQNTRSIQLIESKEAPVSAAVSQNARSIQLIESKEAPVVAAGNPALPAPYHYRDATHVPESLQGAANAARLEKADFAVSQNFQSIQLIESKEAPVATADEDTLPSFAVDQNRRSILHIEGLQTPNTVADEDVVPSFAVDQNRRSIQLIESKEAPIELAEDD